MATGDNCMTEFVIRFSQTFMQLPQVAELLLSFTKLLQGAELPQTLTQLPLCEVLGQFGKLSKFWAIRQFLF